MFTDRPPTFPAFHLPAKFIDRSPTFPIANESVLDSFAVFHPRAGHPRAFPAANESRMGLQTSPEDSFATSHPPAVLVDRPPTFPTANESVLDSFAVFHPRATTTGHPRAIDRPLTFPAANESVLDSFATFHPPAALVDPPPTFLAANESRTDSFAVFHPRACPPATCLLCFTRALHPLAIHPLARQLVISQLVIFTLIGVIFSVPLFLNL
ncbi:hypothetical protein GGU11DRAFT_745654 [Lentinula aff. detonsa]|nr:hypothetical protein GGU11DRAFT_745654 [Lentinula aff. detonsa]